MIATYHVDSGTLASSLAAVNRARVVLSASGDREHYLVQLDLIPVQTLLEHMLERCQLRVEIDTTNHN